MAFATIGNSALTGSIDLTSKVTGTLPVANGGTALTSGFVNGGGLTAGSQWRLTTSFTGDAEPIASNWEVNDTAGYGSLGSAMTESSGTFTFPSTGIWQIMFQCQWYYSGDSRWNQCYIKTTTNNSSYTTAGEMYQFVQQTESGSTYAMGTCEVIFDVTDTAQCKVQFHDRVNNDSCGTYGASGYQTTGVTFVRLGDT